MGRSITLPLPEQRPAALVWRRTEAAVSLFLLLIMVLAVWLGVAPLSAVPDAAPLNAPAGEFSAGRAMQDLAVIAAAPRPTGSVQAAAVRDYLLAEISALGLQPTVQTADALLNFAAGKATVARVENVVVRLPGSDSSGAVLVSGHYDSVPTSASGSDCGGCTAVALETLRAIQAGPPLRNDVIFLFSDSEELATAGAEAFMTQHYLSEDVAVSLVFEAMGTGRASILYATSPQNGAWISEAIAAAPYPMASSFLNDLMWKLAGGSSSDLDQFIEEGRAGFAFAYLGNSPAYHTSADNIQNLDPRSLQHHGEYAVALARHFGQIDLSGIEERPNAVYFSLLPFVVAHYPGTLALPLAMLAALCFIAVLVFGMGQNRLGLPDQIAGALAFLFSLVGALVAVTFLWWLLRRFNPNLHPFLAGGWYQRDLYLLGWLGLTLAIVAGSYGLFGRRANRLGLLMGSLFWWVLLALWTAVALPGFSYLFVWPLLATLACVAWQLSRPAAPQPWRNAIALALAAIPALLLFAPVVGLLAIYSGRLEAMTGLPVAALPIPFAVCLFALLLPQLEMVAFGRRGWLAGGALAAGLAFLVAASLLSGFSPDQPKANTVIYRLDADAQQATWITVNDSRAGRGTAAQLDEWTSQFFPDGGQETEFNPWLSHWFTTGLPALQTAAPVVELPGSAVQVLADSRSDGERQLSFKVVMPVEVLDAFLDITAGAPIRSLAVNGRRIGLGAEPLTAAHLNLHGRPADGFVVEITAGDGPIAVEVIDRIPSLPTIPGQTIAPRPAWMMVAPLNNAADSSLIERTWQFE